MALTLDQVTVRAGSAILLDRVSIKISLARLTVILGPNGAGKSTALATLAGDIRPASGTVRLGDGILGDIPRPDLAKIRAVVSQHAPIGFPLTVHEVVSLAAYPFSDGIGDRIIEAAMSATDILPLAARDYATLSGGERQRVQIARALVQLHPAELRNAPRYLLMDEPTAHLDLKHQIKALETARAFADRGGGVLCILHDVRLALEYADEVILLARGTVSHRGRPSTITPETLAAVFDVELCRARMLGSGLIISDRR